MINKLLIETDKFIHSKEYYSSIGSIVRFFNLNDDERGMLIGRVNAFLIGQIREDQLLGEIMSELEIPKEKAENIENHLKKEVITPFKQKLAAMLTGIPNVSSVPSPSVVGAPSISTLRPSSPVQSFSEPQPRSQPQPRSEENLSKAHLISQIENPPRTTIKRYVIEHDPITDPDHLIDDKVDERPRLS